MLEEIIKKSLDGLPRNPRKSVFVLLYSGEQLKLNSGKSSWKRKNHATSALLYELSGEISDYIYNGYDNVEYTKRSAHLKQREEEFKKKLFEMVEVREIKL